MVINLAFALQYPFLRIPELKKKEPIHGFAVWSDHSTL